jgi:MFS family permease
MRPAEPHARSLFALDWLNFLLADVQTGVGPFLAMYLASRHWNEAEVGLALTIGSLAGIAAQTPAGSLVDRTPRKRALIAVGVVVLAGCACVIALWPTFWAVIAAQVAIGISTSPFIPAICAISLGLVGRARFDQRQGRNQTLNAAGNVTAALSMGWLGYQFSDRSAFFGIAVLSLPTLAMLSRIDPAEIDHAAARGGGGDDRPARVRDLLEDRPLLVFLLCSVAFHFANAAMLPLLGEMLAAGHARGGMLFMSACVITTQAVTSLLSGWVGRRAGSWGRKPLLLVGFGVLPIRGLLYTLTHDSALLIAIQILDGVGVAIFGVVSVLVVADLTRGTGRFNLALGAINTAIGLGASLSQVLAGNLVHRAGYTAGFLSLTAIASLAFAVLYFFMPETLDT